MSSFAALAPVTVSATLTLSRTLPLPLLEPHFLSYNNNNKFKSLVCHCSNSDCEEQRWLREEQRWLREEQRWLREEHRWNREHEKLIREVSEQRFQIQALEHRLLSSSSSSTSSVPDAVASFLQVLKDKDSGSSQRRELEEVDAKRPFSRENQQISVTSSAGNPNSGINSGNGGNMRTRRLFVGGLPPTLTEEKFCQYFESYGHVTNAVVVYDQNTGRPRGFGYISFDTEDAVDRVLHKSFHDLNGKQVEVKRALPKDANRDSSSRMMGGALSGGAGSGSGGPGSAIAGQSPSGAAGYGNQGYGYGGYGGSDSSYGNPGVYGAVGGRSGSTPNSNASGPGGSELQGSGGNGSYMSSGYGDANGNSGYGNAAWRSEQAQASGNYGTPQGNGPHGGQVGYDGGYGGAQSRQAQQQQFR